MNFFIFCFALLITVGESFSAQINNMGYNKSITPELSLHTIHVFGDSHTGAFTIIPGCVKRWLGSITMHRVGRDKLNFLNLMDQSVFDDQIAVFVFGEIDVRMHIGKQRDETKRELDEIIDILATNYINTILLNRSLYNNLLCIVYSVTPPTEFTIPNAKQSFFYGTLEDRVIITKKLNQKLSELCAKNDIPFLDVYEDYANPDGTLNVSLSDGSVHINGNYCRPIGVKLHQILKDRNIIN